jgi:hypothetical protein
MEVKNTLVCGCTDNFESYGMLDASVNLTFGTMSTDGTALIGQFRQFVLFFSQLGQLFRKNSLNCQGKAGQSKFKVIFLRDLSSSLCKVKSQC